MKTYLPRTWVSPKLVPGKSKIHGDGVFAAVPIARGEKLMEFGGLTISGSEAESEIYRVRSIWMLDEDKYLGLLESDSEPSLDENLNHSCDANAWLADEVNLLARKDIQAGEEITLDHGTWNFDESNYAWDQELCSCGAAGCRNNLTENDWQLSDVQERYRGHFHPFVQRMIERRRHAASSG